MENSKELAQIVTIGGLFIANIGAIIGSFISIKVSLAKLEVESKQHAKDIDNIAAMLGTERSKSRLNNDA